MIAVVALAVASSSTATASETPSQEGFLEAEEEVIVSAEAPKPGKIPSYEYMQQAYDARGRGAYLYKQGRFEEAFPYLHASAKRGFRLAQARVGFLFQQGYGTEQDPHAAVAWLGVAARGSKTLPEIRNYFRDVWDRVPKDIRPELTQMIDDYVDRYGANTHGVSCGLTGRIKELTCRFDNERIYAHYW